MTIREERPEEFGRIYELVKTAFSTARVSDGDEQDFVDQLRAGGNYIPQLALVAEEQGELAGHIMLTRAWLAREGVPCEVLLVAPLCVEISHRNQGVGARLMNEGLARARQMGFAAAFLLGDAGYYSRFGFVPASCYGIGSAEEFPEQHFLALELVPGTLGHAGGVFSY